MDRRELQELSRMRLREAKALLGLEMFDGAFYLGGYAVECALKACIAKGTRRYEFPDKKKADSSHTHNLRDLVRIAGLEPEALRRERLDSNFSYNWELLDKWSERSRYERHSPEAAKALVQAIGERKHGVLAWIMPYW